MNGLRYGPGRVVRVPQHGVRWHTESPGGALALAWFSAPAKWERADEHADDETTVAHWDDVDEEPSPLAPAAACGRSTATSCGTSRTSHPPLPPPTPRSSPWTSAPTPGSNAASPSELHGAALVRLHVG